MLILLNGEARPLADSSTVSRLVEELGLSGKRIAVEVNEQIVPRSAHAATLLRDGDCVEIVHAIGGG